MNMDDLNELVMESADVLFDYPEVAMEANKFNSARAIEVPYIKKPFNPTRMEEMQKYYSNLARQIIPIAIKVCKSDPEVGRLDSVDADKIVSFIADTDFNFMAKKISDFNVSTSHGYDSEGNSYSSYSTKSYLDPIRIRKVRGKPALIVTLSRVYFQRSLFITSSYIKKANVRMTTAFNEATNNKYEDEAFININYSSDSGSTSAMQVSLEIEFIVADKFCM